MTTRSHSLSAGVTTVTITPAVGARLIGFGARPGPSQSVRDELSATALVLDDGRERVALVACDLCFIHPTLLRTVRGLIADQIGIAPRNVFVCCSHTHSGPLTYLRADGWALDLAYINHLSYLLAGAVAAAARTVRPARLRVGHASTEIGAHRRRLRDDGRVEMVEHSGGPVDPDVAILRLDEVSGAPLATVVNYACHPVILGPQSLAISADFVGETRALVARATGAPCLFVQGACGDINPIGGVQADDTNVIVLGTRLGQAAISAWHDASAVAETPLEVHSRDLILPLVDAWNPPGSGRLEDALAQLYRDGAQGPSLTPATLEAVMDERMPWMAELCREEGSGRQAIAVELAVLRVGDVAIAGIAGEPFVETGLAIKEASHIPHTLVAGYTNGCHGYLPTRPAYPQGGYEVDEAYRWYRLPVPPAPGCAERVVEEILALLQTCET